MRGHKITGNSASHRVTCKNPPLDRRIGRDEGGRTVPSKDGQTQRHFAHKRRVSPPGRLVQKDSIRFSLHSRSLVENHAQRCSVTREKRNLFLASGHLYRPATLQG